MLYRKRTDLFQFLKDVSPLIQKASSILSNGRELRDLAVIKPLIKLSPVAYDTEHYSVLFHFFFNTVFMQLNTLDKKGCLLEMKTTTTKNPECTIILNCHFTCFAEVM